MSSYEYQVKAKNELIKILKEKYDETLTIEELHLVWFSKVLQNFKCIIIDLNDNQRMYECTYNGDKKEMYLDIYKKEHNILIKEKE